MSSLWPLISVLSPLLLWTFCFKSLSLSAGAGRAGTVREGTLQPCASPAAVTFLFSCVFDGFSIAHLSFVCTSHGGGSLAQVCQVHARRSTNQSWSPSSGQPAESDQRGRASSSPRLLPARTRGGWQRLLFVDYCVAPSFSGTLTVTFCSVHIHDVASARVNGKSTLMAATSSTTPCLASGPVTKELTFLFTLHLRTTNFPCPNSITRNEQARQRRVERKASKYERQQNRNRLTQPSAP